MPISYTVSLRLVSEEISPEEMSGSLGVTPGSSWEKGDLRQVKSTLTHQDNGIEFISGLDKKIPLDAQILNLSKSLGLLSEKIIAIPCNKSISCNIASSDRDPRPDLFISPESVSFCASIGAAIDIDII